MDLSPGYREHAPPAALAGPVACLWTRVVPSDAAAAAPVLPDGCVDLIWQAGQGVFVAGPDTGPVPGELAPGTILTGVRFRPGAGGPALRMPLNTLLDRRVDAADLGTGVGRGLAARAGGALPPEQAARELAAAAAELVGEGPPDPQVRAAARLLARPRASVSGVAGQVGLSERQLRRRCEAAIGYGPATLRRVLRFRRFVSWADAGGTGPAGEESPLAWIAATAGYADQAHLSRECAELAGVTPTALIAARRPAPAG